MMEQKNLIGTPIYYWISDTKATESILFVHAAFADHTSFDKQVSYFSKEYKVIALDLIGHGKSTAAKKNDGIDRTSDYINQLLDFEAIDKAHLVGISIGAVLIQDFANKFPDRVASLCCIGGYDINNFDPSMQKENSGEQMKMMLKALFSVKWFARSNKLISAVTPEAQEEFYQMNIRFKRSSFRYLAGLSRLVNRHKSTPRNYPLMIGCGDKDIPIEIKAATMWHEREPASKLVIFENAGHLVSMDVPDKFNDILHHFLTGRL
jgi:pimeloyl-ACP methyl ester carboxylesterase